MGNFSTPMMRQYKTIKEKYSDCLLFFRLGDFYELFLEDAKIGAKVLNITLTGRSRGKDGKIPMAGIPYHAVDAYLPKLVKAGFKVAICEQVSPPNGKDLVKREVVRIVTPGTLLNENSLVSKENNYLVSLVKSDKNIAIAICDLSTGEFRVGSQKIENNNVNQNINNVFSLFNPSESLISPDLYNQPQFLKILANYPNHNVFCYHQWETNQKQNKKTLKEHFNVKTLEGFGLENTHAPEDKKISQEAAANIINYLQFTQKSKLNHIKKISPLDKKNSVGLDNSTLINLELFRTLRDNNPKASLVNLLDKTETAMGGRLLRKWLINPLAKKIDIDNRLDATDKLIKKTNISNKISELLKNISDLERILSKLTIGIGSPRDLVRLKNSLYNCTLTKKHLANIDSKLIKNIDQQINNKLSKLTLFIDQHIVKEPPLDPKQGDLINLGISPKLDKLKNKINKSRDWMLDLEKQERKKTGISSLKVKFNKVFGFYIEISKTNLDKIPAHYQRKQTLVNAERFITPPLKEHEEIILTAQETSQKLEYQIFLDVVKEVISKTKSIQQAAKAIASLDCLLSFSQTAIENEYTKPKITKNGKINIKNGRHPVVEKLLPEEEFVPNDILLDQGKNQLMIITGPNMAGKSVLIRQVALIVLLAHAGSFVPADSAEISLVDRIFVRSGASDAITSGLSTFMVEMVETAYILNHATDKSLIILDEIGRGTSTYDGISLAWAIAQYIVGNNKTAAKTLFATHYHELQNLEKKYPNKIRNFQVAVSDNNNQPIFLHKLIPGGCSRSHGVNVARMAGVPKEVIDNAIKILRKLESKQAKLDSKTESTFVEKGHDHGDVYKKLREINLNNLTPLEALNILNQLQVLSKNLTV